MILTDDVVSRVARALDPDAWRIADEAGGYDKARGIRRALDYSLRQARAALEAARYGEIVECIARVRRLWIASAFPVNVAEAGEIYDAIDREIALLSTIGESNLKGDRG